MSSIESKLLGNDSLQVFFFGNIDERTDFNQAGVSDTVKSVSVNLDSSGNMNSQGVQKWIQWVQKHPKVKFSLHFVPKIIIDILNIVDDAFPDNVFVESFYVPYINESNFKIKNVLLKRGRDFPFEEEKFGVRMPEVVTDEETGAPLALEILCDTYFKFLRNNK